MTRQVIREERAERELRKAEMEAAKMQNLVDHEDEIYSRSEEGQRPGRF